MPPKRKKSVRQKQKQRQSQSQKVIVNVGKTTPRKRKTSGRGRLPPPSYQQNLFPPTIIQQQAPNIAVLENQISRLTSMIQEPTGIKQPTTPLSADTGAKNAEAQRLAGEQAEARRPGPTAENFQSPASIASTDSQDLEGFEVGPQRSETASIPFSMRKDLVREPATVLLPRPIIAKKLEGTIKTKLEEKKIEGTVKTKIEELKKSLETAQLERPPDEYVTQQLVSDRKPPNMGEGGGGEPLTEKQRKNRERAKKQADEKAVVKRKIDRGEELTEREKKVAGSKGGQIGIKRAEQTGQVTFM